MGKYVLIFLLSLLNQHSFAENVPLFWALDSQEAKLSFIAKVDHSNQLSNDEIKERIQKQVQFMFGSFSSARRKAVPKNQYEVDLINTIVKDENTNQTSYKYIGYIQIEFGNEEYAFFLPNNPEQIYKLGQVVQSHKKINPCTDSEHQSEQYFWYFFNPKNYGCPLKEGRDYFQVIGKVEFLNSTSVSFPEYERLVKAGQLRMSFFFGMDDSSLGIDPKTSKDINARSYNFLKNYMIKQGFKSEYLPMKALEGIYQLRWPDEVYYEKFSKMTAKGEMSVNLFFGPTALYGGYVFHKIFSQELLLSSLVIYDGHSGLGQYLSPQKIELISHVQIQLPQDQYQILFFNGCTTYSYYNSDYFLLKTSASDPYGTKNLDIISNGLATLFSAIPKSNLVLFKAMEEWMMLGKKTSYQQIIKNSDSQNLISVSGDEDNIY